MKNWSIQWHRLQAGAKPSLKALLLSDIARTDALVASRRAAHRRPPVAME